MCGRYYIDSDMADEIEKVVHEIDQRIRQKYFAYEGNRLKEKNTFSRYDAPVLYMTGFCDWFENERRFVILTTAANECMINAHDRMPLILEKEQLADWFDDRKMEEILHQVPGQLKREAEYEQQSVCFLMQSLNLIALFQQR